MLYLMHCNHLTIEYVSFHFDMLLCPQIALFVLLSFPLIFYVIDVADTNYFNIKRTKTKKEHTRGFLRVTMPVHRELMSIYQRYTQEHGISSGTQHTIRAMYVQLSSSNIFSFYKFCFLTYNIFIYNISKIDDKRYHYLQRGDLLLFKFSYYESVF